jgi:hypothetical protein
MAMTESRKHASVPECQLLTTIVDSTPLPPKRVQGFYIPGPPLDSWLLAKRGGTSSPLIPV